MPKLNKNVSFCIWFILLLTWLTVSAFSNTSTTQANIGADIEPLIAEEQPTIDVKQSEMLDVVVFIHTQRGSGSGTIVERLETDRPEEFQYLVLTNAHVTIKRFVPRMIGYDAIRGIPEVSYVDRGCYVFVVDRKQNTVDILIAEIVEENMRQDLAILSFVHTKQLNVATLATDEMLSDIHIFDEVFAVGCQLGNFPSPTIGIISGIKNRGSTIVYNSTAQISPGSSGGGLFREYGGHYFLIGVPFSVGVAPNGQFVSHLSNAISVTNARKLLDKNSFSKS